MNLTNTRKIAACAVMVALLIAVQFAFSMISGVELVSVFFLCFCYVYGIYCGVMTATTFSLMRCLLFGFTPSVIVLYLIYYNMFAIVFGLMGRRSLPKCVSPILLSMLALLSAFFAIKGIPISILFQHRLRVMLWVLFGIISTNPVPVIVIDPAKPKQNLRPTGRLCDLCPTLLDMMGLEQPKEMTGESLIVH